jgi:hypothetical protein
MRSCEARPETCSSILSSRSTKRLIHDDSTANKLQKMRKHNERMRFMPVVDDFFRVFDGQKIKEDEPEVVPNVELPLCWGCCRDEVQQF